MADPIYLIGSDGKPVRMEPTPYDSEEEFQSLLERYPELLAGEQVDRDDPRRWLLVGREVGVSEHEDTPARWSLDHLFVDQDGIPTLVEVKRQGDPRLRREVIGQLLDYAAHARFWTATFLAQQFAATWTEQGRDPSEILGEFLESRRSESESFWSEVQNRLRDGDMRIVIFADSVPTALQQVVEFLNEGMTTTEVLAIEVTRYRADGYTTHVPRVFGRTTEAAAKKTARKPGGNNWSEQSFFEATSTLPTAAQCAIRSVYETARDAGLTIRWGKGATTGSFNIVLPDPCGRAMLTVLTNGSLWLNIVWMYGSSQAEKAQKLLRAIAQTFGIAEEHMKQPTFGADRWTPKVGLLIDAIRAVVATSSATPHEPTDKHE